MFAYTASRLGEAHNLDPLGASYMRAGRRRYTGLTFYLFGVHCVE